MYALTFLCDIIAEHPDESDVELKTDPRLKARPQVLITSEERLLAEIQNRNSATQNKPSPTAEKELQPPSKSSKPAPSSQKELAQASKSSKLAPSSQKELAQASKSSKLGQSSQKELNPATLQSSKPAPRSKKSKSALTSKTVASSTTPQGFKPDPNTKKEELGTTLPTFKPESVISAYSPAGKGIKRKLEDLSTSSGRSQGPSTPPSTKFFKIFNSIEKMNKTLPTENAKPAPKIPSIFSGLDFVGVAGFCLDCDGCESGCKHENHPRKYMPDLSVHRRVEGHQRLQSVNKSYYNVMF